MHYPVCFGAFDQIKAMIDSGQATCSGPTNLVIPSVTTIENGRQVTRDPYSILMEERIIKLRGPFEDGMADLINTLLMNLDVQGNKDVQLYINSPGGSVMSGLHIIDTMDFIDADVSTIASGMAASMGAATLICGAKGKRLATRNAEIMVHQVSSGAQGTYKDMEISIKHTKRLNDRLHAMFVEKTGQPEHVVDQWFDRDHWFTAEEAKDNGIIDDIV